MRIGRRLSRDLRAKRATAADRFPRIRPTAFQGRVAARGLALTLALTASAVVTVPAPGHAASPAPPPAPPGPLTVAHVIYPEDEKGEVGVDALQKLSAALEKTPAGGMYVLHAVNGTTFADNVEWKHLVPLVRKRAKFAIWLGPKIGDNDPATAQPNAVLFALAGQRIADQPTTDAAVQTLRAALGYPAHHPSWCGAPDCLPEIEKQVKAITKPETGKPVPVNPDVGSFILGQARTVEYIPTGSLDSAAAGSSDRKAVVTPAAETPAAPRASHDSSSHDSSSSGVGLVGIVFALVVVLALAGLAVWWARSKRVPAEYEAGAGIPAGSGAGPRHDGESCRGPGTVYAAPQSALPPAGRTRHATPPAAPAGPGAETRPVVGQAAAGPARRTGGSASIRVHSVLEPDGYVDVDGVLHRAFWEDDGRPVPLPGERVRLAQNPAGRFVVSRAP
jgi:hypothetical protein